MGRFRRVPFCSALGTRRDVFSWRLLSLLPYRPAQLRTGQCAVQQQINIGTHSDTPPRVGSSANSSSSGRVPHLSSTPSSYRTNTLARQLNPVSFPCRPDGVWITRLPLLSRATVSFTLVPFVDRFALHPCAAKQSSRSVARSSAPTAGCRWDASESPWLLSSSQAGHLHGTSGCSSMLALAWSQFRYIGPPITLRTASS